MPPYVLDLGTAMLAQLCKLQFLGNFKQQDPVTSKYIGSFDFSHGH